MPGVIRTSLMRAPQAGKPAAPGACATCAGDGKPKPAPSAAVKKMIAGLPAAQQALVLMSPTLQRALEQLSAQGWKVEYRKKDGGFCDRTRKTIVLGANVQTMIALAHEVGHALYVPRPWPSLLLSEIEYVDMRMEQLLRDEGEALFIEAAIRSEAIAAGGRIVADPRVPSAAIYADYRAGKISRDVAVTRLGDLYRPLPTSTTGETYEVWAMKVALVEWKNGAPLRAKK